MALCINCSREIDSVYCPQCGQKNPIKKINITNMWSDFLSRVYGFDGMFPRTLRDLTIRPGEVAREYIKGNRVRYYGPVGYFFLMITAYLLLASLIGVDLTEFTKASNPVGDFQQGAGQQELSTIMTRWVNDNLRLVAFIIAIFSVFFTWLLFKKSKYNLIESSVLIFYVNGHFMWLNIFLIIFFRLGGVAINLNYGLIVTIGFLLFAYANFYTYQAKWKIVIKGLLSFLLGYLFFIIAAIAVATYFLATDKEFFEKMRPKNNRPKTEQNPSK